VRRRDFTMSLALTAAVRAARAQVPIKRHRIGIVIPAGPVALISETGHPFWRAMFGELRRLGDVEGQNSPSSGIPARGGPRAMPISPARSPEATRM
jgi:hypothetical protein